MLNAEEVEIKKASGEMNFVFDLHQIMVSRRLLLVYEGEFTQEITKSVLAMAERNMDSLGEDSNVKRKVFNVMVECLQNIVKHADVKANNGELARSAIFILGREGDDYAIISGNPIRGERIRYLQNRLDQINNLDKEGLKNLYKEIIKNGELSDKGGAGLGFVDMARKSGQALTYQFSELGNGIHFFTLKATISRSKSLD